MKCATGACLALVSASGGGNRSPDRPAGREVHRCRDLRTPLNRWIRGKTARPGANVPRIRPSPIEAAGQTPPCLHPSGNPVLGCPIPLLPHLHELTTVPSLEASRPPPLILIVALHVCPPCLPGPAPDAALLTWILYGSVPPPSVRDSHSRHRACLAHTEKGPDRAARTLPSPSFESGDPKRLHNPTACRLGAVRSRQPRLQSHPLLCSLRRRQHYPCSCRHHPPQRRRHPHQPENPPIAHRGRRADSALPPPLGKSCPRLPDPSSAPSPRTHHRTLTRSVATSPTHPDCRKPLIPIVALHVCPPCLPGPAPDAALLTWILYGSVLPPSVRDSHSRHRACLAHTKAGTCVPATE